MSDGAEQLPEQLNAATVLVNLIYLAGVLLFARWLLRTSLGRKALVDAPRRRNRMPPYTPFIPFAIWLLGTATLRLVVHQFIGPVTGWRGMFVDNVVLAAGSLATIAVILGLARLTFARGLRGFGLRLRTIPRDLKFAFLDLLAVWPVMLAVIVLTVVVGRIRDPEFEMPQHMGLEVLTESGAIPLQVLIVVLAVVVAPLVEEMLFRGMVQSMLRSSFHRPWLSVILTSVLFAVIHADVTHWPALFVLSMGLGYSYEKSGSLWRPIFMHALFNGVTIAAALAEQAGLV